MGKAVHTPFDTGEAQRVGSRTYRKQILPLGSVEKDGQKLDFSREVLQELADNFTAGAVDQVPFNLVDAENKHNDDPEKYRGEVKAMQLGKDGLYADLELTPDGAKLVEDNPRLGVSARIRPDFEKAGKKLGSVIAHVAGTLDPVAKGMNPWEPVSLSDDTAEVVDLTAASYSDPVEATKEERSKFAEFLRSLVKKDDDKELSEERANEIVDGLLSESENNDEPVTELSDADSKRLELAESRASEAADAARKAQQDLADERWDRERAEHIRKGTPPAMVDLAEPILRREAAVIELSDSQSIDAQKVVRELLKEHEGMIDFSERGAHVVEGSERDEARDQAKAWAEHDSGKTS
jgi:hypothetical protein